MSLDEKNENTEWHKCAFESELKNTYDIEIYNYITCLHRNEVNKIAKFNLLHVILNHRKSTKKLK